jgi:branched-chain amino acid transport system substrate-binding protein
MKFRLLILGILAAMGLQAAIAAAADIKIGVAEALSGNAAQYGVSIRKGFELAAAEINGSGGINGSKLALVIEDEQGKKEEAINVFKKLVFQDKVLMVFGPTLSNSAQASNPVAQAAKLPCSAPRIRPTVFHRQLCFYSVTEADILPVTLKVAAAKTGLKRWRCSMAMTTSLQAVMTISENAAKPKILVTTTETFAEGDVDFKPFTKIKAGKPDAIDAVSPGRRRRPLVQAVGSPLPFVAAALNSPESLARQGSADNLWVRSPGPWKIRRVRTNDSSPLIKVYGALPDQFGAGL